MAKYQKIEGDPWGTLKKKQKMSIFEQSHSAEKSEREPLGFLNIRSVAIYQKNEGRTLSHKAEKSGVS